MSNSRFQVSKPAQRDYRVLGGARPSQAEQVARAALSTAASNKGKASAVHVTPREQGWAVKTAGKSKAGVIESSKAAAIKIARTQAAAHGARLVEHSADGRIVKNTKPRGK